jgi:hypothetical protein
VVQGLWSKRPGIIFSHKKEEEAPAGARCAQPAAPADTSAPTSAAALVKDLWNKRPGIIFAHSTGNPALSGDGAVAEIHGPVAASQERQAGGGVVGEGVGEGVEGGKSAETFSEEGGGGGGGGGGEGQKSGVCMCMTMIMMCVDTYVHTRTCILHTHTRTHTPSPTHT